MISIPYKVHFQIHTAVLWRYFLNNRALITLIIRCWFYEIYFMVFRTQRYYHVSCHVIYMPRLVGPEDNLSFFLSDPYS